MISKTVHRRAKLKTLSDSGGPGRFDGFVNLKNHQHSLSYGVKRVLFTIK